MTDNKLGRPPLSENDVTVRLNITVKKSQAEFLKSYGFGTISLGVRRLVDEKRTLPNEKGPV